MALFRKLSNAAKAVVGKIPGFDRLSQEAAQARRTAQAATARAIRLKQEQAEAARLARGLAAAQDRPGRQRAAEAEAQQLRQRVVELARQERIARQEADAARRKADDLEAQLKRKAELQGKARTAYLRTRKNLPPEEWEDTFHGPRPQRPEIYRNRKAAGGDMPDQQRFLLLGYPLSRFTSSNVDIIQFDRRSSTLFVKFLAKKGSPGSWYAYHGITPQTASLFYTAVSKGSACWDILRVRGTKTGHRFNFTKGQSPPADLPLDDTSSAAQFGLHGGF